VKIQVAITKIVDIAYQKSSWIGWKKMVLFIVMRRRILRMFRMKRVMNVRIRIFIRLLSFILAVERFRISKR